MNFENAPARAGAESVLSKDILTKVFAWMASGLFVTAGVAYWMATSERMQMMIFGSGMTIFYVLLIIEVGIVFFMSARAAHLSSSTAGALFFTYAVLNGITLMPLLLAYTGASVATAFVTTAGMFVGMSAYGAMTHRDLTEFGSFLRMGVIGLLIAMIVNLFIGSSTADLVISIMAVIIFVGLTAYDVNKLKMIASEIDGEEAGTRLAIVGALILYLDFINVFIHILRIVGRRK